MLGSVGRIGGFISKPISRSSGEIERAFDGADSATFININDSLSPSLLESIRRFNRISMPPDIRPLYGVPRDDIYPIVRPLYGIPRDDIYPIVRPLYGIPRDDNSLPVVRPLYGVPRPDQGIPDIRPLYGIPG